MIKSRWMTWIGLASAAVTITLSGSAGPLQDCCPPADAPAEAGAAVEQIDEPLDFKLSDLDGNALDGSALKGKVVLLDFWATWCAPCLQAFPALNKLQKDLGGQGFQIVGVALNSGAVKDVAKVVKQRKVEYPVVMGDKKIEKKFDIIGYPTYVLINPQGEVHAIYVGEMKNLYERISAEVTALKKKATD